MERITSVEHNRKIVNNMIEAAGKRTKERREEMEALRKNPERMGPGISPLSVDVYA